MSQKQEKILNQSTTHFPIKEQEINKMNTTINLSNIQQSIANMENMQMNIKPENQINIKSN